MGAQRALEQSFEGRIGREGQKGARERGRTCDQQICIEHRGARSIAKAVAGLVCMANLQEKR